MKIENIIEDIIKDTIDIKNKLEEKIKLDNPDLNFTLNLPDIEKLSAIKLVELSVKENDKTLAFRAEIHTQNGNRVFENMPGKTPDITVSKNDHMHPMQGWFIETLREIIKRRKQLLKGTIKVSGKYNDNNNFVGQVCS